MNYEQKTFKFKGPHMMVEAFVQQSLLSSYERDWVRF